MLDFLKFLYPFNFFNGPLKLLCEPHQAFTSSLFLCKKAYVDAKRLLISIHQSPKVTEITLDVVGRRLVQVFHHINTGRFFPDTVGKHTV
jgi:hypothetical protein